MTLPLQSITTQFLRWGNYGALFSLTEALSSDNFGKKSTFAIAEIAANFASALQRPF